MITYKDINMIIRGQKIKDLNHVVVKKLNLLIPYRIM